MKTISFEVDDVYYQELIEQVGQDNIATFFQKLAEPYLWLNKKNELNRNELSEQHKQILSARLEQYKEDGNMGKPYKTALADIRSKLEQKNGV